MLTVTDEVRDALAGGRPVVALESTIISHGMPYPQNVEMARTVEGIVRDGGAVPATIAVLHGRPTIGLSADDLELLASDAAVIKVSLRDLPYVVSAGLTELSTTSVAVVCAGVKSILDIGLTLEKLETLGVPVLGYGTDEFPSFFSRSSGFPAPMRVDSPAEVAALMAAKWDLGLEGGVVVANPIPAESEIPADEIGAIIDRALGDMDRLGIRGKDATPYLLGRIVELTDGTSLTANIALVEDNARLGAAI